MNVHLSVGFAVIGFILLMLTVDLVAHRKAHVIRREAAVWSAVWVFFGVAFCVIVWRFWGAEFSQQYFAGYVIEKSLAVDNVFVWPSSSRSSRSWGALAFHGISIAAGSAIIASAGWVLYLFECWAYCPPGSQASLCLGNLPHRVSSQKYSY